VAYKVRRILVSRSLHFEWPHQSVRSSCKYESIHQNKSRKEGSKREPREMKSAVLLCYGLCLLIGVRAIGRYKGLEFLEPCSRHDPKLEACLAKTANVLVDHFRQGETSNYVSISFAKCNLFRQDKRSFSSLFSSSSRGDMRFSVKFLRRICKTRIGHRAILFYIWHI